MILHFMEVLRMMQRNLHPKRPALKWPQKYLLCFRENGATPPVPCLSLSPKCPSKKLWKSNFNSSKSVLNASMTRTSKVFTKWAQRSIMEFSLQFVSDPRSFSVSVAFLLLSESVCTMSRLSMRVVWVWKSTTRKYHSCSRPQQVPSSIGLVNFSRAPGMGSKFLSKLVPYGHNTCIYNYLLCIVRIGIEIHIQHTAYTFTCWYTYAYTCTCTYEYT